MAEATVSVFAKDNCNSCSCLVSLANQQDLLAVTEGAVAVNLVDVYRAIGGGWEVRTTADPVELIPEATREELLDRTRYWDRTFED